MPSFVESMKWLSRAACALSANALGAIIRHAFELCRPDVDASPVRTTFDSRKNPSLGPTSAYRFSPSASSNAVDVAARTPRSLNQSNKSLPACFSISVPIASRRSYTSTINGFSRTRSRRTSTAAPPLASRSSRVAARTHADSSSPPLALPTTGNASRTTAHAFGSASDSSSSTHSVVHGARIALSAFGRHSANATASPSTSPSTSVHRCIASRAVGHA